LSLRLHARAAVQLPLQQGAPTTLHCAWQLPELHVEPLLQPSQLMVPPQPSGRVPHELAAQTSALVLALQPHLPFEQVSTEASHLLSAQQTSPRAPQVPVVKVSGTACTRVSSLSAGRRPASLLLWVQAKSSYLVSGLGLAMVKLRLQL
jgi:hypothetical protein